MGFREPVDGWLCWEEPSGAYELGTDSEVVHVGKRSGYVALKEASGSFGAMMQKFDAKLYRGKRLQFAAFVKTEKVNDCGLFMEVFDDKPNVNASLLTVDYMQKRRITGSTDWTKCSIVLDVPETARGINIGARIIGAGKMWIDGVSMDEVSKDVPVTDEMKSRWPSGPQNLQFED